MRGGRVPLPIPCKLFPTESLMRRFLRIATVLIVLALLLFLLTRLPVGYDTDVSQVGDGRPTAVLVHDHNYVESVDLMNTLDGVRREFEPEVLFLVADLNRPNGREFVDRHDLDAVMLVLFDAQGERLAEHSGRASAAELRRFLAEHFGTDYQ
jgi:hypothetical protein